MMTIRHCDSMVHEGIIAIAVEGWQELLNRGICDDNTLVGWNHKALVAEEEGEILGILTYEAVDWTRSWSVVLGYVRPAHRRKGIYTALWEALVAKAREEKRTYIDGTTHRDNAEMQATMERLGRKLRYFGYRFEL
jgi:GNAT superfamily N-acetyltransferase